jgi:hypothetical protein
VIDRSSKYWRRRAAFKRRHFWRDQVDALILALYEGYGAAPAETIELKVENLDSVMQVVSWT